ncbi:hypothetical protein [Bacterioplanoides sp.]|uniref:hypothetical protein n=1 Tax=Bacterioplanoides sp. TaxID=2066072 RepID=UPI003B599D6E
MDYGKVVKFLIEFAPVLSAFMPLIVILLTGWWLNRSLENVKSRLQMDHSIIEKRADIYSEVQDEINNIYSYILRVGNWKELTPVRVLESKRIVDKKIHTTKPYWSQSTIATYETFMDVCFKTYRGHGLDAGIRAEVDRYKILSNWEECYRDFFVGGYDKSSLIKANKNLMASLSKDFGII